MPDKITPVILCGGSGTRLWPRSRIAKPKPFLSLLGDQTLFHETLQRCQGGAFSKPVVVTGAAQAELVDEALSDNAEVAEIIIEPHPRGTAAAVTLAALRVPPDTILIVCPSDHHIGDYRAFMRASRDAATMAKEGWLVCLGIHPTAAETRFGYIQRAETLGVAGFRVRRFVEKPEKALAESYLHSGDFAWNAGIFLFRADDYLAELQKYRPEMVDAARMATELGRKRGSHFCPDAALFSQIQAETLDYALMENTKRAAMVMADMGWSDVGDWQTVRRLRQQDAKGNSVRGRATLVDCRNVLIDSDGPRIHAIGLDDLIIIVDGNDVLIASGSSSPQIGKLGKAAQG
jgi:mannose-1-phosphate guanylyltransferase/mannose-1-phosphate guanylyltransferase/mannose-6-phosphate isomerase